MRAGGARQQAVRDATPADAAVIAEIYNETVAARDATMDLEPRNADYFSGLIAGPGSREAFIVLESEAGLAGWGRIMAYSDRPGYRTACETAVYLRRAVRRRGYGSIIKQELLRRCREFGYHHVVAKVYSDNRDSIEYNLRLGYEIVGVQREIGWVNGRWQDVTIMQLLLDGLPPPG